jgi:hypothetical protein
MLQLAALCPGLRERLWALLAPSTAPASCVPVPARAACVSGQENSGPPEAQSAGLD